MESAFVLLVTLGVSAVVSIHLCVITCFMFQLSDVWLSAYDVHVFIVPIPIELQVHVT